MKGSEINLETFLKMPGTEKTRNYKQTPGK